MKLGKYVFRESWESQGIHSYLRVKDDNGCIAIHCCENYVTNVKIWSICFLDDLYWMNRIYKDVYNIGKYPDTRFHSSFESAKKEAEDFIKKIDYLSVFT